MDEPTTRPVAVVTGASSGIGAATARALAGDGWEVVVGARRADRIEALAADIGGRGRALDVTDPASVDAFVAAVTECRLLVNNAGGALGWATVAEADDNHWRTMFETNVLGTMRMVRGLLPALEASGDGHVVTIGSIAGHEPYPLRSGLQRGQVRGAGGQRGAAPGAPGPARAGQRDRPGHGGDRVQPGALRRGRRAGGLGLPGHRPPCSPRTWPSACAGSPSRPSHVNVDQMIVLARDQAGAQKIHRRAQ